MAKWLAAPDENDPNLSPISVYDLPFGMEYIRRSKVWRYPPISPTFTGFPWEKKSDLLPRGNVPYPPPSFPHHHHNHQFFFLNLFYIQVGNSLRDIEAL